MADFGIRVSSNGNDAKAASGTKLVLQSKYPLAKIDTTNPVSFQNVRIQFNNNLPLQTPTLLYQFAHGYKYTPSTWAMAQVIGTASPYTDFGFMMDNGALLTGPGTFGPKIYATLGVEADATNVYIYGYRVANTLDTNSNFNVTVAGLSVRVRIFVFVEDVNM